MAESNTRAGTLFLKLDGVQHDAKGSFKVRPGGYKKESIVGADQVHGAKQTVLVPGFEGVITDKGSFSILDLQKWEGTATLELANGKTYVLVNGFYAGEGELDTEEGEIALLLEGQQMEEVLAS